MAKVKVAAKPKLTQTQRLQDEVKRLTDLLQTAQCARVRINKPEGALVQVTVTAIGMDHAMFVQAVKEALSGLTVAVTGAMDGAFKQAVNTLTGEQVEL